MSKSKKKVSAADLEFVEFLSQRHKDARKSAIRYHQDLDAASMAYEEGIVLSINEVGTLLKVIEHFRHNPTH